MSRARPDLIVGRLAPSPTGALHLGNARTFLLAWLSIRARGGRVILRIEDLDGPRIKFDAAGRAIDDLRWLGLDWDEGPIVQTKRLALYEAAFERLRERGLVYPCACSRKDVETAASAPHPGEEGPRYPGTCRGRFADAAAARAVSGREPSWRFRVAPGEVTFVDGFHGRVAIDVSELAGDFVVRKGTGTAAYQLAVVVDDSDNGITEVFRGDDLVSSTPRQLLLYRALDFEPPSFVHVPLIVGEDGLRLAKRHGDTTVHRFREAGVRPERIAGLLAEWSGLAPLGAERMPRDLVAEFDLARVPRSRVICPPESSLEKTFGLPPMG
ncbi:MAG: tRNA glutamyl-Q(34) synthetase GluQRS [Planctomycetes bacterium]|nr:tRNA glutamyl-Q(34) synthetase GluQRS [Planctomycetota bacterium]MBI3845384.1 tRNA glutamyl-Q(34) synthetase GluQRS [Planctomycetota bacterium]